MYLYAEEIPSILPYYAGVPPELYGVTYLTPVHKGAFDVLFYIDGEIT